MSEEHLLPGFTVHCSSCPRFLGVEKLLILKHHGRSADAFVFRESRTSQDHICTPVNPRGSRGNPRSTWLSTLCSLLGGLAIRVSWATGLTRATIGGQYRSCTHLHILPTNAHESGPSASSTTKKPKHRKVTRKKTHHRSHTSIQHKTKAQEHFYT